MPSCSRVCKPWQTAKAKRVWKPTLPAPRPDSTSSARAHRDFTWRHYSGEDSRRSPKGSVTVAQSSKALTRFTAEGVLR